MHTRVEQIKGPGSDMPTGRGTLKPAPLLDRAHAPSVEAEHCFVFTGHGEKAEKLSGPSG